MALTDEQFGEMRTDIKWIRERLQKGDDTLLEHNSRINELEKKQATISTKIGAFIIAGTFMCTLVGHAMLWVFQQVMKR